MTINGNYSSKGRQMGLSPTATTPRDPHKNLDQGNAANRGTSRKENHFSFGKAPNKKG